MKSLISVTNRKQTASFRIAGLMLAIAPLCLMLAAGNTSAHAQTSADVSSATTSTAPSPADWTQFHRDNMQRWNPYETVLGVNNAGALKLLWSYATGGQMESSPAVANGVVYVGSDDHSFYAVNASTGVKLWSFATNDLVQSSPAVANGVAYIGGLGLYALNASTGAQLWIFNQSDAILSPAVANGVVYVGDESNGDVYAVNANSGAKLWSYAVGGANSLHTTPAIANGIVYVGADDHIYALSASSGVLLWSYATGGALLSSPAVANGVVYFGSRDNNVYALNASTGTKLWSYATGFYVDSSPAVANGIVYVGSDDNNVYALNASTGAKLWSFVTSGFVSSPAVANGVVYVGSQDTNLYALNASTGAKLWSYATGGALFSSPSVVNGVVYGSSGNNAFAFEVGVNADQFLRISPSTTTVHQGDLLTYAFPVWNLGPNNAAFEVLNTQVPAGTTFDYIRISGTPGLGTCTTPPYQGTGQIVCHQNASMAPNTTWTVRLTVKVTAPSGTVITENAATIADTPDPNLANNTATVSLKVQ